MARGLGILRLVTNLLHFYDAAGTNLVLVVGADDRENEWIGEGRYSSIVLGRGEHRVDSVVSAGGTLCY